MKTKLLNALIYSGTGEDSRLYWPALGACLVACLALVRAILGS